MKPQNIIKTAISLMVAAVAAWLLTDRVRHGDEVSDARLPAELKKEPGPTAGSAAPAKALPGTTDAVKDGPIPCFGGWRQPLELSRKTVFERIKARSGMYVQTQILPDAPVAAIEVAYRRLMKGAVFMGYTEPLWGVEDSEYFYFSGSRRNPAPAAAFLHGDAVRKDNGRIYAWFPPQSDK